MCVPTITFGLLAIRAASANQFSICSSRRSLPVVFGTIVPNGEWREKRVDGVRIYICVALNERRRGTRIRALSHEISIQNALRALVPRDYIPGAMNLPLRGRPEIATFLPALFPRLPPFHELLIHRRYAGKRANEVVADFSATS